MFAQGLLQAVSFCFFAILAVLLAGCGGGSSSSPPPVQGINAETGKTIQSDDWMVTLLGQASKDKVVGDEEGEIQASISQYEQAVRTAQGVWIIVPIELKNQGDEANMLLSSTIMIADDQGREYPIGDRLVHHSQVWISEVTRWEIGRINWCKMCLMQASSAKGQPSLMSGKTRPAYA